MLIPGLRVVTTNPGKWAEFSSVLQSLGVECSWIRENVLEIQSDDLGEIAYHAGLDAYRRWGGGVMVEDAGLYIDALNGFPGPYSSYIYRTIGVGGVLRLLAGVDERNASFRSAICYVDSYGVAAVFTGEVEGYIAAEPRGSGGFGFDPIFIPREGDGRTFAEMTLLEKNVYSHRVKALKKLIAHLGDRSLARDI